ncbi:MAG: hypothetical protein WCI60_04375 [bacterium]
MAFPGELNINYYKGDTYDFNLYPKTTDGLSFNLENYSVIFTIAEFRGGVGLSTQVQAYASIINNDHIACKIRPSDGRQLSAGTTYIYDVQITNSATSPATIYTIITGTIAVTDDVTGAV